MGLDQTVIIEARYRIIVAATSALAGKMTFIECSREIIRSYEDARIPQTDPDILPFIGVDSETMHLPIGSTQQLWAHESIARIQPEMARLEAWAKAMTECPCKRLLQRKESLLQAYTLT